MKRWKSLLTAGTMQRPLSKSLMVATWTMLCAIGLAAPAAYVVARLPQPWKYGLLLSLFASRMIPEVGIALPVAVRFLEWGLADTQLGLVLAHLIKTLPNWSRSAPSMARSISCPIARTSRSPTIMRRNSQHTACNRRGHGMSGGIHLGRRWRPTDPE